MRVNIRTALWLGLIALLIAMASRYLSYLSQPTKGHPMVTTSSTDPLGPRPQLSSPIPYKGVTPEVYRTAEGMDVWLIERHDLPAISLSLAIPSGSADDPKGKGGLAQMTASMLDEGAGERDAIAVSTTITDLGAELWTGAGVDASRVALTVLRKHLPPAFEVFADVVARPRFEEKDWKRVSELWRNQLRRRSDSPEAVARLVRQAVLYGPNTPYGHPTSGDLISAEQLTAEDLKSFHQTFWRPDRALLVVAGDINRKELDELLSRHLGAWRKPKQAAQELPGAVEPRPKRPRLVLVDRPDAPQSVVSAVGPGVSASDPNGPLLDLLNTALGGSFTSRLNQNLREDNGWTYGARTAIAETRGIGAFVASAAVFSDHTGDAIRETLKEISLLSTEGLRQDELHKVQARDVTDLIETHETLDSLVGRLTSLGTLGRRYDFDGQASAARQLTNREQLQSLARKYLDVSQMTVVIVGPMDKLLPQLEPLSLGEPEYWTAEGRPVAAPAR